MTKITMIDYGASNIRSAQKAFEHLGADITLTSDPAVVRQASKLVLPGVGAFGSGMAAVRELGLHTAVQERVATGVPLLGICVGMQFLFDTGYEMGTHQGLALVPGEVHRFDLPTGYKIPHMGWNQINHGETHWLLQGVPTQSYVYFVHSYHCTPTDKTDTIAVTEYGQKPFTAVVGRDHVYGIQFHPEKSQKHGLKILQNYIDQSF